MQRGCKSSTEDKASSNISSKAHELLLELGARADGRAQSAAAGHLTASNKLAAAAGLNY